MTVLDVKDLKKDYRIERGLFRSPSFVHAVSGVSLSLEAGKTLALVGESGCGKTTLAKLIMGIETPDSGELVIGGMDALHVRTDEEKRQLRQKVQIVFQDPYSSLNPRKKIGHILDEPLKLNTSLSPKQRYHKIVDMLQRVGLKEEHYHRYPHMFSGGQRQRIAIARSLMLEPELIVLDEPVSALDISIQAQVLNLLMELQEEMNLSYLFISHDLGVVRHIADHVLVMYLGTPVEYGACQDIFSNPQHPYTRALLAATPIADPRHQRDKLPLKGELPSPLNLPKGCVFSTRCLYKNERCEASRPNFCQYDNERFVACYGVEEKRLP